MLIKYEINKYEVHRAERLNELLYKSTNYDLLFIGSSRTHLTVNPRIIDSICSVNSYNAGIEGGNLFEFNMMLQAFLENHPPPKDIVLTLDLRSFVSDYDFFNYTQYFSFTKNKVIRDYLNRQGYSTVRFQLLPFLEVTEYDHNTKGYFLKGLLGYSEIREGDFQYKGYVSNTNRQMDSVAPDLHTTKAELSQSRKKCLDDIIQTCKQKKISIIFTYAPEYKGMLQHSVSNSKEVLNYIDSVAVQNSIPFFRDDRLSICSDPKLFVNAGHLNRDGADLYSAILANHLKNLIKK
ncbi:MAG: hypothetical protein ABL872_01230 [Lacibacter sp.]